MKAACVISQAVNIIGLYNSYIRLCNIDHMHTIAFWATTFMTNSVVS